MLRLTTLLVVLVILPVTVRADGPPAAAAIHQSATEAERAFKLEEAWGYHLQLAELFPKDQWADSSLRSAMMLADLLGRHKDAAKAGELFLKYFPLHEGAPSVALQVALAHEKAGNRKQAKKAFELFLKKHGKTGIAKSMTAHAHLARAAKERGLRGRKDADKHYAMVLKLFKQAPAESGFDYQTTLLAGEAAFHEAERTWDRYTKLKIKGDSKAQRRQMQKMQAALKDVQAAYRGVFDTRSPRWVLAAMYRSGEAFEHMYNSLVDAPFPTDLPDEEEFKDQYATAIEDVSFKYLDQATGIWGQALHKAREFKERGPWVDKLRDKVERYTDKKADAETPEESAEPPLALPVAPSDRKALAAIDEQLVAKDYAGAEKSALQAIRDRNENAGAMLRLGIAWMKQGKVNLAAYAFDRATELDAENKLLEDWRKEAAMEKLRRE
jgi:cellulose synthase operon protein C